MLSDIKVDNICEMHENAIHTLHSNFSLFREAAAKTKSKVNDGIIDLVLEAVQENTGADEFVLS